MKQYGKPIYHRGEFDGYDDIVTFCDDCGEEHKARYNSDYDCDLCPACEEKRVEGDITNGIITEF